MFEFNLNQNELEALDNLILTSILPKDNTLPAWDYMGQNVWEMDLVGDASELASEWTIETADVA